MSKRFLLLSIEGPDQVGKNTQTKLLADHYHSKGLRTLVVEVPIKSFFTYHLIYFMLRKNLAGKYPKIFHFLQFINKFWWQIFVLPRLVCNYDVIVMDRWNGSYWVYGLASGVASESNLMRLYHVLLKPHQTFVLLGRTHGEIPRDEYEKSESMQDKVRNGYRDWALAESNVKIIYANQSVPDVHADIVQVLKKRAIE